VAIQFQPVVFFVRFAFFVLFLFTFFVFVPFAQQFAVAWRTVFFAVLAVLAVFLQQFAGRFILVEFRFLQ
jgi:hypothetical protein